MVKTLKMQHNINIEVLVQYVHTLITSVLVHISQTTMQLLELELHTCGRK